MIIDCHAHVFQNWHGACGHPSIDVHLKYMQKNVTRPAAETFRVRDGKRVKPGLLFREGDNTWAGLKDVDFRVGRYGQLEFTHEGEEYAIQYMPVGMQEIECPPEFMIAQMIYADVDHCILQAGGGYGAMNDYNAFTQSQHPEKFTGLLHIDEAIADRAERARRSRPRAWIRSGCRGSTTRTTSRATATRAISITRLSCRSGTRSSAYGFPAFIELSSTPNYDSQATSRNLMALDRVMQRHPAHPFVLVMGPPVAHFARAGKWDFPPEVLAAYRRDNLLIEVMFPITWGGVWDYPYPGGAGAHPRACATCSAPASWCGAPTCPTSSASAPTGNASTMSASTARS